MRDMKTRENIGDNIDASVGLSLAYKMRKGLLRSRKVADGIYDPGKDAETEVSYGEETAEKTVGHTAAGVDHSVSTVHRINNRYKNKQNVNVKIDYDPQITELKIEKHDMFHSEGAADTAAPSFGMRRKDVNANKSKTVSNRPAKPMTSTRTVPYKLKNDTGHIMGSNPAEASRKKFIAKSQKQAAKKKAKESAKKGAKSAGKAIKSAVSSLIDATKGTYAIFAAGGSVPLIVIILLCAIAIAAGSVFGMFFAGEEPGTKKTMQVVVQEVNEEYRNEISKIKAENPHEMVRIEGSSASWRDILSVYAVIINTDPNDPQEVVTLNSAKIRKLHELFWEMTSILYCNEIVTELVEIEISDEEGNTETVYEEKEVALLHIVVTHRTAYEMAGKYDFDSDQMQMLTQLLDKKNDSMWTAVLYGIRSGDTAIIEVAKSQLGNEGGETYWSWYGFTEHVNWCACFVSWCANECGYIEDGLFPKHDYCPNGVRWFMDHDQWVDGNETPSPGMLIYFDYDNWGDYGVQDGKPDHVGIVEKVEDGWVYTIEGNSGDVVAEHKYQVGYYEIIGFGFFIY